MSMRRRAATAAALVLLGAGIASLAGDAWLAAKAAVARVLIDRSFERHVRSGDPERPWPWADTWPIARIDVPRLAVRRTVLAGASGSSLAFGPGHLDGTVLPNEPGLSLVAGHRDGAFAFLQDLRAGDTLIVTTAVRRRSWRVVETLVLDEADPAAWDAVEPDQVTLVTCWPFGGLVGGRLRYVVRCVPDDAPTRQARHASVSAI